VYKGKEKRTSRWSVIKLFSDFVRGIVLQNVHIETENYLKLNEKEDQYLNVKTVDSLEKPNKCTSNACVM
jgi:hypothetical protein